MLDICFFTASQTSPVLDRALESAKSLFEGDDVRETAKKVLLILTDRSSGLEESALRTGASNLENNDIEVIAVSIGEESDVTELAYVTPHTGNIIDAPVDKDPDRLSSEIVKLIRTGEFAIHIHIATFTLHSSCLLIMCLTPSGETSLEFLMHHCAAISRFWFRSCG